MKRRSRFFRNISLLMLAPFALCSCTQTDPVSDKSTKSNTLYVKKVENMPEDFILGMDISSVIAEEDSGVTYYNFDGEEQDVFQTLAENGINYIRVRIWNDPYDKDGHGYGGGNNDIEKAVIIGKRAAKYGLKLIVDFHYSDFWADPQKQMVPLAWKDMTVEEKTEAVYEFTKSGLEEILNGGGLVGLVQIGNETNGALCGESEWSHMQSLMKAGARAVREVCPDALIALHFTNPERKSNYAEYAKQLNDYQVDYDVFASSYYPFWHGTLDNLASMLTQVAETYGKKTMVMETSYPYTLEDTDFYENTISAGSNLSKPYPISVQGQADSVRDIIDMVVNKAKNGIGIVYWEGAWISVGGSSRKANSTLWETYGSGWATSYAATYDPDDAGKYYGGNSFDNQALFDAQGKPLESLKIFHLVRSGNEIS